MTKLLAVFGLGAILLGGGWLYYSGAVFVPIEEEEDNEASQTDVERFTDRMRTETVARVGQPIEGFEPFMFMQAFPGLIASDFANIDALIGFYRYEDNEIVYDLNGEVEVHSAARAISDEGMAQLLANISARVTFMAGEDMVDQIFFTISPDSSGASGDTEFVSGERVTLEGIVTCLPHKGDGPHTMECAFGLHATSGTHYGLSNLWDVAPTLTDTNVEISVTGTFSPALANEKYDIAGYIEVESAERL